MSDDTPDPEQAAKLWQRVSTDISADAGDTNKSPTDAASVDVSTKQAGSLPDGKYIAHFDSLIKYHDDFLIHRQGQRDKILFWSLIFAGSTIAGSMTVVGVYLYLTKGGASTVVLTTWFTAVVVETLGILYIVAEFLFPKDDHAVENLIGKYLDRWTPPAN